jgi:hypothetical protein
VASASQRLPPEDAADSPAISRRILGMGAAEATERIGPHHYTATIGWEWNGNQHTVRLKETRDLQAGKGGVSGDFDAQLTNSDDQGLEVIRVGGEVFARTTYGRQGAGRFRERRRDRGMAERTREEAYGAVKDFDNLFRGRLKLTAQGTSTVEGRTAWKYSVSLADPLPDTGMKLPPRAVPKTGLDETTARRLAFYDSHAPRSLQGEVLVDSQTSVVLKAKLDGRIAMATDGGDAELRLTLETAMTDIGRAPQLAAPKDFLPDEDKPVGIAAAMERFGVERRLPDGGLPSAGKAKGGEEGPPEEGE